MHFKHLDILCGACYRSPENDSVSLDNFFEYFHPVLDKIHQLPKQYIIVMLGDFNAHYLKIQTFMIDTNCFPMATAK